MNWKKVGMKFVYLLKFVATLPYKFEC